MSRDAHNAPFAALIALLLRHRVGTLILVGLVTGGAGFYAARVRFSNSIEMWFMEGDPELMAYDDFSERFGGDEIVVIGVVHADVFSRKALAAIGRMSTAAEDAPHVLTVRSLTRNVVGAAADTLSDGELANLRERALASDLVRGWLVSPDATATAILVEMDRRGNTVEGKTALVTALRGMIEQEQVRSPETHLFLSGTPVLDEAFFRYNHRDVTVLFPLSIGLVLIAGVVAFRRLSAALLQLGVVVLAVIWAFGLMGVLGLNMSILSTALLPLLLAIGVADAVHVLSTYDRKLADRRSSSEQAGLSRGEANPSYPGTVKEAAIVESVAHLMAPCFSTSLTTAVGLLSLTTSPMQPIREFGALGAAGVGFAFLLSITFLPVALALLPVPAAPRAGRARAPLLDRLLATIARPTLPAARRLVVLGAVLLVGSVWLASGLDVGVYALSWFPEDDPVVRDIQRADRELGGSSSLEFLVRAPGGGLAAPEVLDRLDRFERWLESTVPGLTKAVSIADVRRAYFPVAETQTAEVSGRTIEEQFAMLSRSDEVDMQSLVQEEHSIGRITARMRLDAMPEAVHAFPEIDERLKTEFDGPGVNVEMTGYVRLMGKMEKYLLTSQIRSFAVAFVVVTLIMMVLLRSFRMGLIAMIPNFLPVVMGLGAMAWLGIGLNPGTVMIGALAMGLVVDDTVHFLVAFRRRSHQGGDTGTAIEHAVRTAGRPMVITSLILMVGFGVLTFGSFNPNIQFGAVAALVIGFALLCDLLLLPAVLTILSPPGRPASSGP